MTPDIAFQIANALVLPQWLLMVVAPRWSVTQFLVKSFLIPVMLAGWIHYLAFDLIVGSVVMRNAHEHDIAHGWVVVPILFCFMLGPIGLLLYWIIRTVKTRKLA